MFMKTAPHVQMVQMIAYLFAPIIILYILIAGLVMNDEADDRNRIWADSLFFKRNVEMWKEY